MIIVESWSEPGEPEHCREESDFDVLIGDNRQIYLTLKLQRFTLDIGNAEHVIKAATSSQHQHLYLA